MSVLEQIRAQGFILKPVDSNGLYVNPINGLSDIQRQWLTENKTEVRRQLLDERWHWFLSLATEHGINACVVAAEFPTPEDRLDVIEPPEHDDDTLRACMATLCRYFRVQQRQRNFEAGNWVPEEHE